MKKEKKVVLLILDGWGIGKKDKFNAIDNAKTPNVDKLIREYPNVQLRADGSYVGLPEGQFGTSEINHQVIGTGMIVMQDLPRIDTAIQDETFFSNEAFIGACKNAIKNNSALHLVGIVSDGKVHSSLNHLLALIKLAKQEGIQKLFVHAFADGRDVAPKSVEKYLKEVDKALKTIPHGSIATLQGRFYLDRDRDWEKTEKAVNLMFKGTGMKVNNYEAAINYSYNQNISDEFFEQYLIDEDGLIKANDSVIFFHYRTDRLFQLLKSTLDEEKDLFVVTLISVSDDFKTHIAYPRQEITHTLARSISEAGKSQLHLTETEKYTHLTFFFNAGREKKYEQEEWELIQSNRFVKPFYNFEPSMKAFDLTKKITDSIKGDKYDFIVVNFPNTDMVGHTGNYEAAVIAAESVDYSVGKIYEAIKDKLGDYALLVTADHGNSDEMWDYENEQPHTQHTLNPVPFILVSDIKCKLDKRESLHDIAPTILDLMKINKPESMKGESLIIEEK